MNIAGGWNRLNRLLAAAILLSHIATGSTLAAEPPEGLFAGPWVLTPYLVTGYEYDSNPFYRPGDQASESILIATPGVGAELPFRNSTFKVQVEHSIYDYQRLTLGGNSVTEIDTGLALAFSSSDRLEVGFQRSSGLARTTQGFDQGGEAVFQGDTFDLNTYSLELSRSVYGQRGYQLRLDRRDLVFDPGTSATFFDYRGWDYRGEFRQPVGPSRWLVLSAEGRTYDHFKVNDPAGSQFRQEDSRIGYIGLDGSFARQWRTRVRAGYGQFRFPMADGSDFSGWVGDLDAQYRSPGKRLEVGVQAVRRPYASFFLNNTHYMNSSAELRVEYAARPRLTFGGRAFLAFSTYGDRLVNPGDPQEGLIREDRTRSGELFARMELTPWVGLTVSARASRRKSNYEGAEYEAESVFGGLAIGWR